MHERCSCFRGRGHTGNGSTGEPRELEEVGVAVSSQLCSEGTRLLPSKI